MKFLAIEEIYAIHLQMIKVGGGRAEIHNFALLHSAVERPKATFGGEELYPTIWLKAAALLHSLVKNHPFDDGNKRTAYYSTKRYLVMNGFLLDAPKPKILKFMVNVDIQNPTLKEISTWLQKHSQNK